MATQPDSELVWRKRWHLAVTLVCLLGANRDKPQWGTLWEQQVGCESFLGERQLGSSCEDQTVMGMVLRG